MNQSSSSQILTENMQIEQILSDIYLVWPLKKFMTPDIFELVWLDNTWVKLNVLGHNVFSTNGHCKMFSLEIVIIMDKMKVQCIYLFP